MSPLISVPQDDLQPEYIGLPDGRYQADFTGAQLVENDTGWRAIEASFENFTTGDGATQVATTFKGRELALDLAARTKRARYTIAHTNPQAVQIGARDIARLAQAIGAASNGDGAVTVAGDTPEEVVATLAGRAGVRVNLNIKNRPRKRAKIVQTNEKGEPIIDDEITRVWPIETE
jgi:hypothetical protein